MTASPVATVIPDGATSQAARPSFRWDDPFEIDRELSEEERLVRDSARAYAQDRLQPRGSATPRYMCARTAGPLLRKRSSEVSRKPAS